MRLLPLLFALTLLAGCASPPKLAPEAAAPADRWTLPKIGPGTISDSHVPAFAEVPYERFTRADAIGIAQREWRLFGQLIDDDPPDTRPPPPPEKLPERMPGLWERVGEYWWEGVEPGTREVAWTGMHDERGATIEPRRDIDYAWSAAFISYIMRIAGAGPRFPYSGHHSTYINAAARGASPILVAHPIDRYAPRPGDLICAGRDQSARMRFAALPTHAFASHCDFVAETTPTTLTVIGGNVDDAVTEKHIPLAPSGLLAGAKGKPVDDRYPWFVVLEVKYDR